MKTFARSGAPLYLQVSEALESRIDDGEFPPGEKLPGDVALSAEYGISVITARAAMRVLIDKLLVVRYPGKGTFVREDDGSQPVWGLGSMLDLAVTGLKTKLVLLDRGLCVPAPWAAKKFGQSKIASLYLVRTARESKGKRFAISDVYYPSRIGKLMKQVDFEDPASHSKLMITLLQEHTGARPRETYQTITAEIARADDAERLGVLVGAPLLVLSRDYYDAEGNLIQAGRSKYRVDSNQYRISFSSVDRPSSSHRRNLVDPE